MDFLFSLWSLIEGFFGAVYALVAPFLSALWAGISTLFPLTSGVLTTVLYALLGLLGAVLGLAFFLFFAPNTIVGYIIYTMHLKRTKKTKWTRECSENTPVQTAMYETGLEWSKAHQEKKQDVHIVNDGLNLYGEFYDFGSEKTVIMVSGRTEGLRYAYYFAKPYGEMGYNVLTIDQRAHGESDGKYNTVGFEEYKDLLAWAEYLYEHHHSHSIVLHGICIGAASSIFALTNEKCPDYIKGMVAEGMFPNFWESFRNHMIELKKPMCGLPFINAWMKLLTGYSMKYGPADVIHRLNKPLLMLHGKEDLYSLPEEAEKMYGKCGTEKKRIVWFERGRHSQLRFTDAARYDGAVKAFLSEVIEEKQTAVIG